MGRNIFASLLEIIGVFMSSKKKTAVVVAVVIVVLIAVGVIGNVVLSSPVDKSNEKIKIVKVEQGSSTGQIANALKKQDTIKSTLFFKIKSKLGGYDGKYKAGQYAVSQSMSLKKQMDMIKDGETVGKVFTIPDGNTLEKDAKLLAKGNVVTKKAFLEEAANGKFDYDFLKDVPKGDNRLEGFLYPETYQVDLDADAHEVINTMLKQFDKVFTDEYYKQAEKMDMSVLEVMTVASIIEREAKTDDDKKNVASVIYNRLEVGMPLQMDSILAYITGEEKIKASLSDTQVESDYNPYTNKGLPPGPICSPGKASIEAALYPAETDYLYFVATEKLDGTNVFSENYEEFLKDKEAFDKAYKKYIKEHPDKK